MEGSMDEDSEVTVHLEKYCLPIAQFLVEHELMDTLTAFERETGIAYKAGDLPVASMLKSCLDMFGRYGSRDEHPSGGAEEELLQQERGACVTAQSEEGPTKTFVANVTAVAWLPGRHFDELFAVVATTDRHLVVLSAEGQTLADFADLPSPVLWLDAASCTAATTTKEEQQEAPSFPPCWVLATAMGGETSLLKFSREDEASCHLELMQRFKDHTKHVTSGVFSPPPPTAGEGNVTVISSSKSSFFVTVSRDQHICVYRRRSSAKLVESDSGGGTEASVFELAGRLQLSSEVTCCCWVSLDTFAVAARDNCFLHYYQVGEDGPPSAHLKTSLNPLGDGVVSFTVLALVASPDFELLAACTDKSRIIVLRTFTDRQIRNLHGAMVDEYDMPSIAFSLDRTFIYATSSLPQRTQKSTSQTMCGEVVVFEVRSGETVLRIPCHDKPVRCMARHPKTEVLLTGSFDKTVKCWS